MTKKVKGFKWLGVFVASCLTSNMALAADIAVIGGPPDDGVWGVAIKKGIDDARFVVEANGGSVNYLQLQTYDNFGPDSASLIRTAIAQGVNGLVLAHWVPESQDEAIKAAVDAGIKVMFYNSGTLEAAERLGVINFIGADLGDGGAAGGKYLGERGYKKVLCVNTLPGITALEDYCREAIDNITKAGGDGGLVLPLPSTSFGDPTAVSEAIKATLLRDADIDSIMAIGNVDANAATVAIAQAGKAGSVALGSINFGQDVAYRIQDGTQTFAIDLQAYLHAFLAVSLLAASIDFGADLPVKPLPTGPVIMDSENLKTVMPGVEKGIW